MKIALAGGLGIENAVGSLVQAHTVLFIGSAYDWKSEKFIKPDTGDFRPDFLTQNYRQELLEYDLLIDISENLKSKYIMNDVAVSSGKPLICLLFSGS